MISRMRAFAESVLAEGRLTTAEVNPDGNGKYIVDIYGNGGLWCDKQEVYRLVPQRVSGEGHRGRNNLTIAQARKLLHDLAVCGVRVPKAEIAKLDRAEKHSAKPRIVNTPKPNQSIENERIARMAAGWTINKVQRRIDEIDVILEPLEDEWRIRPLVDEKDDLYKIINYLNRN